MRKILLAAMLLSSFAQAHTVYLTIDLKHKTPVFFDQNALIAPSKTKGGTTFHVYHAALEDQGKVYSLEEYGKWNVSKKATALVIRLTNGKNTHEVKLPAHVSAGLLQTFIDSQTKVACGTDFECGCFVHSAHGFAANVLVEKKESGEFELDTPHEYWTVGPYSAQNLIPGDVIRLFEQKTPDVQEQHFALHLAPNMYISKFGGGAIYATDLVALKQVYRFHHIETWKPIDVASCKKKVLGVACVVTVCALAWFFSSM
jgi:hypothetical protein